MKKPNKDIKKEGEMVKKRKKKSKKKKTPKRGRTSSSRISR